jgi:PAS domain S-box-containing protein
MRADLEAAKEQDSADRAIFEASSDGLVINDAETGVVFEANPAFCQMHGYERMDGLHPSTFIHPNSHHLFERYVRAILSGQEYRTRAQDVRRDGSVFDVEVFGRGFVYQGRPALIGVVRDVTENVGAYHDLEQLVGARTREADAALLQSLRVEDILEALADGHEPAANGWRRPVGTGPATWQQAWPPHCTGPE